MISQKSKSSKKASKNSTKTTTKAGRVAVKPRGGSSNIPVSYSGDVSSIISLITGDKLQITYSPADLVKLNKGYVAICNNKNSATIANVPVKLYYNSPASSIKSTQHKRVSNSQFNHIKNTCTNKAVAQLETQNDIVEIVEHPILDLLSVINNQMNYVDFVSFIQQYLGLIGNGYVKINLDSNTNLPKSLDPLLSEYVTPVADNAIHGKISGYKYTAGSKPRTFSAKEIIHFINYTPGSRLIGVGELEQCINAVTRYNYYDEFESCINRNYGRPDYLISYKNKISKKDLDEVYKQLYKRLGGSEKGKPVVTSGDLDVKELGFAPKDMSWMQGRKSSVLEIANSFGVPESMIALNSSNLASALTATNEYFRHSIFPKMSQFIAKLNEVLVPMYAQPGLFLWYDGFIKPDAVTNSTMVVEQFNAGLIDREEARQQLGLDPDPIQSSQEGSGRVEDE